MAVRDVPLLDRKEVLRVLLHDAAQTDPSGFIKAAVALMPRQIKMDAHLNDMTVEQLEASIRQKLKELDLIDPFIPKLKLLPLRASKIARLKSDT